MVDSTNLPEVDINQIATDLNNKMDRDGVNATCPVVISRTANNVSGWTEIWSDGYCVQTGIQSGTLSKYGNYYYFRINLPQAYKNSQIRKQITVILGVDDPGYYEARFIATGETDSFAYYVYVNGNLTTNNPLVEWRTEGYIR